MRSAKNAEEPHDSRLVRSGWFRSGAEFGLFVLVPPEKDMIAHQPSFGVSVVCAERLQVAAKAAQPEIAGD